MPRAGGHTRGDPHDSGVVGHRRLVHVGSAVCFEVTTQLGNIPAGVTPRGDQHRFDDPLLPPADQRAAVDTDRPGGDTGRHKIVGHVR